MTVWLASASPRRRALLEAAGLSVEVHPSHADESRAPDNDPASHAVAVAARKAASGPADRVVLAADTVVHQHDRIFEKPVDRDEARAHLSALSGAWHVVTTGVCVRRAAVSITVSVDTRVRFRRLAAAEIERYLATGEADDKAGAYGIQGAAAGFVAELHGSYTNVIGLPLEETLALLERT